MKRTTALFLGMLVLAFSGVLRAAPVPVAGRTVSVTVNLEASDGTPWAVPRATELDITVEYVDGTSVKQTVNVNRPTYTFMTMESTKKISGIRFFGEYATGKAIYQGKASYVVPAAAPSPVSGSVKVVMEKSGQIG
jgi:hypothetical protein